MSEVRLQVKNLCKNFGITKAVQNVSFNVNTHVLGNKLITADSIGVCSNFCVI